MDNFFKTADELGGSLPFHSFDLEHFGWLIIILFSIVLMAKIYNVASPKKKTIIRRSLGTLILFIELLRKYTLWVLGTFTYEDVPLHLCSISIYLCFIHAFKPSKRLDDALFMLVLPGAMAALIFPDWNVSVHLNFFYIHSWVIHGLLIMYPIILLNSRELIPNRRHMPFVFVSIGLYAIPIYFLNKVWDTNFLFINTPSPGSPLVFLESLLGNPGYIFGLVGLCLIVWSIMYTISGLIAKSKARRYTRYSI